MFFEKIRLPKISLRFFNNCLTVVVATFAIYIMAAPFLPQIGWWVKHDSPIKTIMPHRQSPATLPASQQVVDGDKLFIPRLEMDQAIYGGSKVSLSKGVWHVPHTSTPDKGGNTVLVGHRFTYKDPTGAVFYHLDKVQTNDPITVHWQGKIYQYKVSEIKVVPATELSVEDNTKEPQLTIYTCTPLWSVKNRLVVIAKPVEAQE
jgi:LPXTG-site transpeptidase (sortase) family protein